MKTLLIASVLTLSISAFATPVASGKLILPKAMNIKAQGIRTVFISIYDPKSSSSMPCAAQKFTLEKDAQGEFLSFTLDSDKLTLMGCQSLPEKMRLKAKLDQDGNAGRDTPADIIGIVDGVKKGASKIKIELKN